MIHSTAIIDSKAKINDKVRIGPTVVKTLKFNLMLIFLGIPK